MTTVSANYVDIFARRVYPVSFCISQGKITDLRPIEQMQDTYVLPGFIDAHVHIESSMLIPSQFARMAAVHGTVATVSDPHEIANVLGVEGVRYMLEDGKSVPFKFYFGAPSCVPATTYETAGAVLSSQEVEELLKIPSIKYLSEMMNYPGVLYGDEEVHRKIAIAKKYGKPIDGHAPGLRGEKAKQYIEAGISTDHECFTLEEALEKLSYGMKVIIREGSAAKNFEALHPLIASHPQQVMFCSDDKHPDDLLLGHMNLLVKRALQKGYDLFDVLRIACLNPVEHYHLEVGLLREGDAADFIVVDDLKNFNVLETYIDGQLVAEKGRPLIQTVPPKKVPNFFNLSPKQPEEFAVRTSREKEEVHVIVALDGEIVTHRTTCWLTAVNGKLVSDVKNDVLKIAVVNRYEPQATIGIGFIKGFGLKAGAIAASVAHDSHNLIAIGTSDELFCEVINALINQQGGIAVHTGEEIVSMPLPVAGLMSTHSAEEVGHRYAEIDRRVKQLGSTLKAPFMTLSFMALLVIPSLKLSDKGLFDGERFSFLPLVV